MHMKVCMETTTCSSFNLDHLTASTYLCVHGPRCMWDLGAMWTGVLRGWWDRSREEGGDWEAGREGQKKGQEEG